METSPAIEIRDIRKTFNGTDYVLDGVSLSIPRGSVCVLIGFSGTGKSVLLRHILGLEKPTSGEVFVLGTPIHRVGDQELTLLRQKFGMLFQNAALFDDMNTLENVSFPLVEHRRDLGSAEIESIAKSRLRLVGLSDRDFNKLPSELSGGMRKRVGLARAIALDPEIILYDEPTTGLDPIMTEMVDNLILDTHRHRPGRTTVIVTHDLEAGFRIGDYVAMLDKGKILLAGGSEDFARSEIEIVKRFIAKAKLTRTV